MSDDKNDDKKDLEPRLRRLEARATAQEAVNAAGGPDQWVPLVADRVVAGTSAEVAVEQLQEAHRDDGPPKDARLSDLSESQRRDYIDAHGLDAYRELLHREYS